MHTTIDYTFGFPICNQVLSSENPKYGYNAATGQYEDLMAAGIIDPTKVSRLWRYQSPTNSCA